MPFGLKDTDIQLIQDVFCLHSKVKEVVIFGSRAMGTERLGSDIDLAVKGTNITTDDIVKMKSQLDELPVAYMFDIVDYDSLESAEFIDHINRYGISFYVQDIKPSGWETYKLGELAEVIVRGISPKYAEIGVAVINQKCIREGKIKFNDIKFNDVNLKKISAEKYLRKDDILINSTGEGTLGRVGQINFEIEDFTYDSHVTLVRIKENFSRVFVGYKLKSMKSYIESMAEGSTGQTELNKEKLKQLEISIPNLPTQRRIASILSSLDDKIELNLKMNQTLEAMAQAIFKEWFINFNFPGFDGRLVDGLPKGWRQESIDKCIEFLNGLALQKYPPQSETEYLPVIKIRELRQGITESSDKASLEIPKQYIVAEGDVLFSWSGSLEIVLWCDGKGALNQHLFKVSSKRYPKWFYYLWTKNFLPVYQSIALDKATTMGHIQRRHLTETIINVPDIKTMELADSTISPIIQKLEENKIQIRNLTQIRDSLLPRLMSGKIEVKS